MAAEPGGSDPEGSGPEGSATAEPEKRRVRRRSVLIAGTAGLATTGLVLATGALPVTNLLGDALDSSAPPVGPNEVVIKYERVYSQRRRRDVDVVTILPSRARPEQLPVCLMLHGLHGNARRAAPTGLARHLIDMSAAGTIPPFAFVALDGGDNYWHENQRGDNSMAMLLDEVPRWMRERGLGDADGVPFACAGISMGGFGALLYGRRRNESGNPAQAIAAISPGLLTSWREMSTRKAFKDTAEWASLDPLRNVEKLGSTPIGIWCGTEDHFIEGARKFIKLAKPDVAFTGPGGHGDPFYKQIVPGVLAFLGKHAPVND